MPLSLVGEDLDIMLQVVHMDLLRYAVELGNMCFAYATEIGCHFVVIQACSSHLLQCLCLLCNGIWNLECGR